MTNTPIPSRDVEYSSCGTSEVREYKLTPEQLEEVRQKYPATKADKTFKKPFVQRTKAEMSSEEQRRQGNQKQLNQEEDKDMAKFKMTAEEYFAERQAGKSQEQIAEEQGVTPQAIDYHLKKWADEGKGAVLNKTQLLREKDTTPDPAVNPPDVELLVMAKREIVEVRVELATLKDDLLTIVQERDQLTTELAEAKRMFDDAYQRNLASNAKIGEHLQAIQELKTEVEHWQDQATNAVALAGSVNEQIATERDDLQAELNRMIAERDDLDQEKTGWIENERILNHLVEQLRSDLRDSRTNPFAFASPTPISEVQLLDRSIADLTRARWILNRLTASGE